MLLLNKVVHLLNSDMNVQVSDTTADASSNGAG